MSRPEWQVGDRVQARVASRGKVWIVTMIRPTVMGDGQLLVCEAEVPWQPIERPERRSFRGTQVKAAEA